MAGYSGAVVLLVILNICCSYGRVSIDRPDTGVPCEWDGVRGTCVDYWTCLTNAVDAVNGVCPPICSRDGDKVMTCCTGCDLVANISSLAIVTDYETFEIPTTQSRKKCIEWMRRYKYPCNELRNVTLYKVYVIMQACHIYGWSINKKEGVTDQQIEEFKPIGYNMALLGYGRHWESAEWLCAGSIISDRYILTAAHCGLSAMVGEVRYVAVGVMNRSEPRDSWQIHAVEKFIPHPEYEPSSMYHDIALIKTARRILFSKSVLPACLSQGDDTWTETGFPFLWRDGILKQMNFIFKYDDEECARHFPASDALPRGFDNNTQICYGRDEPVEFIQGDHGAPLQTGWCPACILGVTSSDTRTSPGLATPGPNTTYRRPPPGLYTRVEYYLPWIENIVWPTKQTNATTP